MGLFNKKRAAIEHVAMPVESAAIPAEVVAAIAGAVAVICGEEVKITGIRRVSGTREAGRSAWSLAGLLANTRPFNA